MMPKLRAYVKTEINGYRSIVISGVFIKISPLLDSDVKVSDGMIVLETSKTSGLFIWIN